VAVAALAGVGCAGSSCDDLAQLRLQRDEARVHYATVIAQRTPGTDVGAAHDTMHELDKRVHRLEQNC
jgi:hypothetical protein